MKIKAISLLCAILVLAACGSDNEDVAPSNPQTPTTPSEPKAITFNLTASHPDDALSTRAVKTGWESGDAIFVFFTGSAAPKYLKMTYNGTEWTSAEYNGASQSAGALGLRDGDSGTMRAVFLPFGSTATVSANGTNYVFSKTYYAYYLTATLGYTVEDGTVSGNFNMTIPDGYVQFSVADASAVDETYSLGCDAIIPVGVASIAADGTVHETTDKTAADDMPGYAYGGGYLFSGKINSSYNHEGQRYYFAKTKNDDTRADYFVRDKTIASHDAVKLPANDNAKWVPVGSGMTVALGAYGNWYTCNYGCNKPEEVGTTYTFTDANALGVTLPDKTAFENIKNNCTWRELTIHGKAGAIVWAEAGGFMFLPKGTGFSYYWSSTQNETTESQAYSLRLLGSSYNLSPTVVGNSGKTNAFLVRPIQN